MNSLGVDPYVNYLYTDLTDGQILFQIYDIIQPGIVDWKNRFEFADQMKLWEGIHSPDRVVVTFPSHFDNQHQILMLKWNTLLL